MSLIKRFEPQVRASVRNTFSKAFDDEGMCMRVCAAGAPVSNTRRYEPQVLGRDMFAARLERFNNFTSSLITLAAVFVADSWSEYMWEGSQVRIRLGLLLL